MRLSVQHALVQMGHTPPQGNIKVEQRRQLFRRSACIGVAPGTKGHQQPIATVKGQVAVHHGADPRPCQMGQLRAANRLYICCQGGIAVLHTGDYSFLAVRPQTVHHLILPQVVTLGNDPIMRIQQHSLNAGGAELHTQYGLACGHSLCDLLLSGDIHRQLLHLFCLNFTVFPYYLQYARSRKIKKNTANCSYSLPHFLCIIPVAAPHLFP